MILTEEEKKEYSYLLQKRKEAISRVSFAYSERELDNLNHIIDQIILFKKAHSEAPVDHRKAC